MDRWITLSLAGVALIACVLASVRVIAPVLGADATLENPGGVVLSVEPGGIAWEDGIRTGQKVVALSRADEVGGWRIVTERGDGTQVVSRAAPHERKLRASWPVAVVALMALVLAVAWLRRRPRESELASVVTMVLAAAPLSIAAGTLAATFALPAAMVVPAAWLLRWSRGPAPTRYLPLAAAIGVSGAWLVARAVAPTAFDAADQTRFAVTVALAGLVLVSAAVRPSAGARRWLSDPQVSVVLSFALMIAVGLLLTNVVRVPLPAVAAVAAVAVLAFPRMRRLTSVTIDRLIFAELRARSASSALEAERARVAREVHDAPLQELSGVIRRLDLRPELESETDALRGVADQLRSIATELYPPVLQDLGLTAALKSVVQKAKEHSPDVRISLEIDESSLRKSRPPADVELAVLRIVQEAMNNALRHAQASQVKVVGHVSAQLVRVSVQDDGRGIERAAARRAQEAGHLGLVSMEQHAAAVGAQLHRRGAKPSGTRIEIRWQP